MFKKTGMGLAAIAGGAVLLIALILFVASTTVFSAHVNAVVAKKTLNSKVTSQVFNPNNKIQSQGYFETLNANFEGYLTSIKIQRDLVVRDDSPFNETNLTAMRLGCVQTAQDYNAASRSISSEAFKSADLPYTINSARCAT